MSKQLQESSLAGIVGYANAAVPESRVLRVGIADDHAMVRHGLKELLLHHADITVVGEAADGGQAIELARRVEMDVLVMDLAMPKRGGLDALGSLNTHVPKLAVLILSAYPEEQYAFTMIRLGAAGYINKTAGLADLVNAIRTVGCGKRYPATMTTPALVPVPRHASQLRAQAPSLPHDLLTKREFQVFLRLARGETVGEIGRGLALSFKTISTYRTGLMRKLAQSSNSDLTRYAVKHRLID